MQKVLVQSAGDADFFRDGRERGRAGCDGQAGPRRPISSCVCGPMACVPAWLSARCASGMTLLSLLVFVWWHVVEYIGASISVAIGRCHGHALSEPVLGRSVAFG
jgi:hypothetical protein